MPARVIRHSLRSPERSPERTGRAHGSLGCYLPVRRGRAMGSTMAELEKTPKRACEKNAVCHLHAKIVGGRLGASVQLARRPARSLRSLHSLPETRRLDAIVDAL